MGRTKRRDYGSGSVYRRGDGLWIGTVELGWQAGKRKRKTVSGKTKADVVAKLKALDRTTVATNIPTVSSWLRTWLDELAAQRVAPRTLQSHRTYVERHLIPNLGSIKLDKLAPPHILHLHQQLRATPKRRQPEPAGGRPAPAATLEEATVLRAHAVLSRALTDAMRLGLISRNPAKLVDRPGRGRTEPRFLDADQAVTLLRAVADDPDGSRWAFALLTGQRQGECLGLRWAYVDLDGGFADIAWKLERVGYRHGCTPPCGRRFAGDCPDRALAIASGREHHVLDGGLVLTRPKGNMRKIVPLVPSLVAWLRRHREEHPPGRHDLVWSRAGGRPVDPRRDWQNWTDLLAQLGLPPVDLHSARHTCVSLLLALGVQEAVIMQMVGHSTVAAARSYQHLDRATAMDAALRLGQALQLEP